MIYFVLIMRLRIIFGSSNCCKKLFRQEIAFYQNVNQLINQSINQSINYIILYIQINSEENPCDEYRKVNKKIS